LAVASSTILTRIRGARGPRARSNGGRRRKPCGTWTGGHDKLAGLPGWFSPAYSSRHCSYGGPISPSGAWEDCKNRSNPARGEPRSLLHAVLHAVSPSGRAKRDAAGENGLFRLRKPTHSVGSILYCTPIHSFGMQIRMEPDSDASLAYVDPAQQTPIWVDLPRITHVKTDEVLLGVQTEGGASLGASHHPVTPGTLAGSEHHIASLVPQLRPCRGRVDQSSLADTGRRRRSPLIHIAGIHG
jgi:hypothetical protein